ncbi:DNA-binding protein WhiA [Mycoplasma sp. 3341]|uniref:DNA-binding protein WhiA n=1 Tax=Mycoplasma sp. 3341 TaxID=3447506 RepID=UPI003F65D928
MKETFTSEIKQEIISRKITKNVAVNFIHGFLATQKDENCFFTINKEYIRQFVFQILQTLQIEYSQPRKNQISFVVPKDIKKANYVKQNDYFAAIFLLTGSVSDVSQTMYHLEVKFSSQQKAKMIQNFLEKYDICFRLIERKKQFILYIKKVESICDFLKAIGAINAYMKFEEAKINRDYTNAVNRLTNFDFYNQQRLASKNTDFLVQYQFILDNNLVNQFTQDMLDFFELKKQNLDLGLSDLVLLMSQNGELKSKSTLYYYLKKLSKIYLNNQEG